MAETATQDGEGEGARPPPAPPRPRARRLAALGFGVRFGVGFGVFVAAVVTFYVFIVSAGHFTTWRTYTGYYDKQAEGFRSGHLYTTVPVPPALKTLKDPLDPVNMHHWRWDYSYYKEHIYMYWGLLPPAILALVKSVFRIQREITDDPIVLTALVLQAVAGALLVRAMAGRLTPRPPGWSVWLAMVAIAVAHPTPWLLARAGVYEGAIVGGSFFLVLAFGFVLQALFAARENAGLRWLMAASLCAGCAGASRANLLPAAAAMMTVATLGRWRTEGGDWRRLLRLAPLAAAPMTLVTFAHLLLNRLRFGEWAEFGQKYQMGNRWFPYGKRFLPPNIFVYFFRAPSRWCHFPFITAEWGSPPGVFPKWLPVAEEYRVHEPTAGLFVMVPLLCFLLVLPMALGLARRARRAGGGAQDPVTAARGAVAASARWRWFVAALAIAALGTVAVPLLVGAGTMRYQGDFAPALLLMALVGAWAWLAAFRRPAARAAATAVFLLLAAATIVAGPLLGLTGYFTHFKSQNPQLMHTLQRLYVCKAPDGLKAWGSGPPH